MTTDSPVVVLFNSDGYEVNVQPGVAIPAGTSGILASGSDGTNSRFIAVDSSGRVVVVGAGVAGTPAGGVVSVQGVSGGQAIPISGTVTATNASTGATGASPPSQATYIAGLSTTSAPSYTNNQLNALSLTLSGALRVDGSAVTQPVSGTVTANQGGTWNINNISGTISLPTGAATETTLASRLADSTFTTRINTLGQKTMANSTPVVIASDQSAITITGTVAGTGNFTVVQGTASNLRAQTASESATGASPPPSAGLTGGSVTTSAPTYTNGQMSALSLTTAGALRVDGSGVTQPISVASLPLPTGAATEATLATRLADSTFTTRINTLGQKTMANSTPVVFASDQTAIPASQSGSWTVTANAGTGNFATNIAQYGGTNVGAGNAVHVQPGTGATFTVVQTTAANLRAQTGSEATTATATGTVASLTGGAVTTSAPTYTTGQMNPLSLTTAGALRVDGSGVTQPISGTVTVGNLLVVQGNATDNTSNVTSKVPVIAAVATTVAPTYSNGNMVPLSTDTSGNLRVAGTVAATQSGTWTVQPGNTANTTPWLTTISQGGNSAAVKAASTAPVAADPALVVTVSPNSSLVVTNAEYPTFTSIAANITQGNNKSMISLLNGGSSTVIIKVREIHLRNSQITGVTGVAGVFELRRFTGHSAGTVITAVSYDTNDTLNVNVTSRTGATIAGETDLLGRWEWSTDDWRPGTLDQEGLDHTMQSIFPIWKYSTPGKGIVLRPGQGVHVKFATNSTAGSWDLCLVYTQE